MNPTLLSLETYKAHVEAHYGGLTAGHAEFIAEVMRGELLAHGFALRWILESRVYELLTHFGVTREQVADVRRTLESIGDVQSGPGGEIAPAPLRGVRLGAGRWMVVGAVPTSEIRKGLDVPVTGLPRRLSTEDETRIQRFVADLGGHVLEATRFAGLDRVPLPDIFMDELNERLENAARYHDRASVLRWDDWDVFEPSAASTKVWHKVAPTESARIVRAKQSGGWLAYGWACQTNALRRIVPLSPDEARRAMLVYRARAGLPAILPSTRTEFGSEIHLPVLLPSAEYRWLAAMGESMDEPRRVRFDATNYARARGMLEERLFVMVEEGS